MLVSNVTPHRGIGSPGTTATGVSNYFEMMRVVGIWPGVKMTAVGSGWLVGTEMVI